MCNLLYRQNNQDAIDYLGQKYSSPLWHDCNHYILGQTYQNNHFYRKAFHRVRGTHLLQIADHIVHRKNARYAMFSPMLLHISVKKYNDLCSFLDFIFNITSNMGPLQYAHLGLNKL